MPPYRAILRYYRCDTPYRAILFKGGRYSPKMVRYPLVALSFTQALSRPVLRDTARLSQPPYPAPRVISETSKRHLKRQQPQSDAKSDTKFVAIVQFLTCHFTVVAFRGRCTILQKSSFHGCRLAIVVVWRSLCVQHLPLNDGQVEKSSFHGHCYFGTSVGRTGTLESRSFEAVVVSCVV